MRPNKTPECILALTRAGIDEEDAYALRRCSMRLHNWYELECGDGDNDSSWTIARGKKTRDGFEYDEQDPYATPYLERHHYRGDTRTTYTRINDREKAAHKRLKAIVAKYDGFAFYLQTDPRGASIYILRPGDIREGQAVDSCYTNGIAVYK